MKILWVGFIDISIVILYLSHVEILYIGGKEMSERRR